MRLMAALIVIAAVFALQACGPKQLLGPNFASEADCGYVQNAYGQRISWKGQVPIPLYVHESFPASMKGALEAAVNDWNTTTQKNLFYIAGYDVQGPLDPRRDGANVIYWMSTWESDKSNEQARTSIYWEGDQVREADVRLNAKDFTFYDVTPLNTGDVHLQSLLVHELGHVLGLRHKDTGGSVMATYLQSQTMRTTLSKTDLSSISCEY